MVICVTKGVEIDGFQQEKTVPEKRGYNLHQINQGIDYKSLKDCYKQGERWGVQKRNEI